MFMEHLALTYKCHSSIGNSLNLKEMLNEVLETFVDETNAVSGYFYFIDENNDLHKYLSYKEISYFDENDYLEHIKNFNIIDCKKNDSKILIFPLEKGIIFLVYEDKSIKVDYIGSMFMDFRVKLNISIDACLNVDRMKNKNKMLKHLTAELKQQQKELLEADKYKSNFLANMSHELKTPLNSIIVLSSIMKKNKNNKLDQDLLKNVSIINNCGNDLLHLINDILDISKIEAGEVSLNLAKCNLNILISMLMDEMQPLAVQKNLEIINNTKVENLTLLSDEHRIKQILKNLLSNAIKFTEKGNIELVLEENANDITIKVIDEGIGIAQEKLGHIFDRFKQADGSTTRKYGGTGLGLAISRELAYLLGGDIKAFSKLGSGSTFELILPKKTNIKNVSDDKVSISSNKVNEEVIEDIVLFDMDIDLKDESANTQNKVMLLGFDYAMAFPVVVGLKKHDIIIKQSNLLNDAYDILDEEKYDLIVIDEENIKVEIEEFVSYCKERVKNILIIGDIKNDSELYFEKQKVKGELISKILTILGK